MRLRPPTVDELVSEFLSGEDISMFDGLFHDPESVWEAVLRVMKEPLTEEQVSLLAAGPVEDLLAKYGIQFIDRMEAEAKRNPAFAHLLGGVWQNNMPNSIWQRVEVARGGKFW